MLGAVVRVDKEKAIVYIGLGSNLGDKKAHLQFAVDALVAHEATVVLAVSSLYRSAFVGGTGGAENGELDFLNAVLKLQTTLKPMALLKVLQEIEHQAGRLRPFPNAPRTLDLDILLYDSCQIEQGSLLQIPHPRMRQRAFVLYPLQELAPEYVNEELLRLVCNQPCELAQNVRLEVYDK